MNLRLVLTGAGGFFTSRLARHFETKYEIIALTRKALDVTNAQQAMRTIKELKPDIIVHAAAMTATADCEKQPQLAYEVNTEGAVNIARAAQESKAKMIFLSTEQVFNGNPEDGPYREEQLACPNTVYGKSKLAAETLIKNELEQLWILRFSWLFGLPERNLPVGANLLWHVLKACITGKPLKVPVNEYRGITYVYDIIDYFDRVWELPYGTYHFSASNNESTYETAVFIMEQLGIEREQIAKTVLPDYEKYREKKKGPAAGLRKNKRNRYPRV